MEGLAHDSRDSDQTAYCMNSQRKVKNLIAFIGIILGIEY
jgi:hypothetical protein